LTEYYILGRPKSLWGDYGDILVHGMSCHLKRDNSLIQLERTGPFVPPISFPGIGDLVVTDEFRKNLDKSGLSGLQFQPVIKKHIVHLDWHLWDKSVGKPPEHPEEGEPENYILTRPHSNEISAKVGDLWEVLLKTSASVKREQGSISLICDSWQGEDIFHANGVGYIYVTEKAKDWLENHVSEFVSFRKAVQI
jgi:hypothetical protein